MRGEWGSTIRVLERVGDDGEVGREALDAVEGRQHREADVVVVGSLGGLALEELVAREVAVAKVELDLLAQCLGVDRCGFSHD